jgi:hypothetical protein
MSKRSLVLTTLCCVVPFSVPHAPASAEPLLHDSVCPYAKAEAAAVRARFEAESSAVRWSAAPLADLSVTDVNRSAPGLLP